VFVGCVSGQFNAIDAATGKIVWKYRLGAGPPARLARDGRQNVYIGSMSGQILALPANVKADRRTPRSRATRGGRE
jgi:outer membrane protein assembly factor BamB